MKKKIYLIPIIIGILGSFAILFSFYNLSYIDLQSNIKRIEVEKGVINETYLYNGEEKESLKTEEYLVEFKNGFSFNVYGKESIINDFDGDIIGMSYTTNYFSSLLNYYIDEIDNFGNINFYSSYSDSDLSTPKLSQIVKTLDKPSIYAETQGSILILYNFVKDENELNAILNLYKQMINKISDSLLTSKENDNEKYNFKLVYLFLDRNNIGADFYKSVAFYEDNVPFEEESVEKNISNLNDTIHFKK